MAKDPSIPNLPQSVTADQVSFFTAIKTCIEVLSGQGRNTQENKALRVNDLKNLGIDVSKFLNSSPTKPYDIVPSSAKSFDTPEAPTNLVVTKGSFVHILTWDNPADTIVSHIEVWVADSSQDRADAKRIGIVTLTTEMRGKPAIFQYPVGDITHDYTYWIRSISYAEKHSPWHPPDNQGGYVIPGNESVQEAINTVLGILQGEITENELYADLSSRIDLIDTSGTGLLDRLASVEASIDAFEPFTDKTYAVDDIVTYNDKIYKCILAITSTPAPLPTNTTYWEKIGETASLAGNITANASAISDLDTRVTTSEGDIVTQASNLTAGLAENLADSKSAAKLIYSLDMDEPINTSTDIYGADEWLFTVTDLLSQGALVHIEYEDATSVEVALNGVEITRETLTDTVDFGSLSEVVPEFGGGSEEVEYLDLSQTIGSGVIDLGGL